MRKPFKILFAAAVATTTIAATSVTASSNPEAPKKTSPPIVASVSGPLDQYINPSAAASLALDQEGKWLAGVAEHHALSVWLAGYHPYVAPVVHSHYVTLAPVYQASTSTIEACVKGVESGNYSESTHLNSGSGAYQFIPGTWREYFGQWQAWYNDAHKNDLGFVPVPYYSLAAYAPPWVQDEVFQWTLDHGGAGAWSGVDPCTGH